MMIHEVLDKHYKGKWGTFASPTGTIDDFENIVWIGDPPNKSDFKAIYDAEKKAFTDAQYQRDRKIAYPSLDDVIVALAEKAEGNDTMWQEITTARAKVKSDFPKPT